MIYYIALPILPNYVVAKRIIVTSASIISCEGSVTRMFSPVCFAMSTLQRFRPVPLSEQQWQEVVLTMRRQRGQWRNTPGKIRVTLPSQE